MKFQREEEQQQEEEQPPQQQDTPDEQQLPQEITLPNARAPREFGPLGYVRELGEDGRDVST